MYKGKCIFFSAERGFGFLSKDMGGPDVFCHFSNLEMDGYKKLDKGDRVEFDIEDGPNGKPQAVRVQILEKVVA